MTEMNGVTIMVVAAMGVVINTATALMCMRGRKDDLNIKGAFLHMAADALVSAGVVASGLIISATGWNILDPLISIVIAGIIVLSGWGLLKDSLHTTMAGVPAQIGCDSSPGLHDRTPWSAMRPRPPHLGSAYYRKRPYQDIVDVAAENGKVNR